MRSLLARTVPMRGPPHVARALHARAVATPTFHFAEPAAPPPADRRVRACGQSVSLGAARVACHARGMLSIHGRLRVRRHREHRVPALQAAGAPRARSCSRCIHLEVAGRAAAQASAPSARRHRSPASISPAASPLRASRAWAFPRGPGPRRDSLAWTRECGPRRPRPRRPAMWLDAATPRPGPRRSCVARQGRIIAHFEGTLGANLV